MTTGCAGTVQPLQTQRNSTTTSCGQLTDAYNKTLYNELGVIIGNAGPVSSHRGPSVDAQGSRLNELRVWQAQARSEAPWLVCASEIWKEMSSACRRMYFIRDFSPPLFESHTNQRVEKPPNPLLASLRSLGLGERPKPGPVVLTLSLSFLHLCLQPVLEAPLALLP